MSNEIFIRDVVFQLPNATGNFTITDSGGPGLTPKGAILCLSGSTAGGLAAHARMSIGMTDGTNHRAIAFMAEDDVIAANADSGRRYANDKVLNMTGTTAQGLQVGATFTSFGANAITINVDAASTLRGFVRLWYGADLTCHVGSFLSDATVDTDKSYTSPGFMPDGVFIFAVHTADFGADVGLDNVILSIGAAGRLSSITQSCVAICAEDRQSPTSVGSKPRNDRVASRLTSTAGVVAEATSVELKSFDSTGITVTTRDGSVAMALGVFSFKLGSSGEKCYADCPALTSSSMGEKNYTTPGFRPRSVLLVGQHGHTINTIDSTTAAVSLGGAHEAFAGAAAGWNDIDNLGTSQADSVFTQAEMLSFPDSASTINWSCSLVRMTASGFDYNVTDAHDVDLNTLVFSIGEQPGDHGWFDARSGNRWRRCLARR